MLTLSIALLGGCRGCAAPTPPGDAVAVVETVRRAAPLARLEAAFAASPSLTIAERIKCLRLRRALAAAGVTSTPALPVDCVARPLGLGDGEALLSFFAHRGRLHRFLVVGRHPPRRLKQLALAKVEPLLIKARDSLELGGLETADIEALWRLLARAHHVLLGDVEQHLTATRHLVVLPDGLLKHLPLHVLRRPDGTFTTKTRSHSTLPCLALRRPPAARPAEARLFVPGYGGDRQALPGALTETRDAAGRLGRASVLTGARVTARRLADALQLEATVVHYAGHGLPVLGNNDCGPRANGRSRSPSAPGSRVGTARGCSDEPPGPSELVLGGGRTLATRELASGKPLRAPLVVLASCAAAYPARFRDGERRVSPLSLVEVLLARGVGSVIAASWAVKDGESARQMRLLYGALPDGPAPALAQVYAGRQRGIRPPHPRFWGAYALYGAPRWQR